MNTNNEYSSMFDINGEIDELDFGIGPEPCWIDHSMLPRPIPEPEETKQKETPEKIEILHPVSKTPYLIDVARLAAVLNEHGKKVKTFSKNSAEIKLLIDQFCDHTHVDHMKENDARQIKNSGFTIDVLSTKKGKNGKYKCLFCPLLGQVNKSFPNKENLIRHNALHLRYSKFKCPYCDHKHFRNDTIKQHIKLKHPTDEVRVIPLRR